VDPGDFEGSISALFYPDEFSEALGITEMTDGLYVDNQKPKRFNMSYRTLIGSGNTGDMFGYQIHLLYNAVATIGTRSRKTMNQQQDLTTFTFDLTATPVQVPGFRPSAHYIIDTRNLDSTTIAELETILYGSLEAAPRLPEPVELFDLLNFGNSVTFTDHGDGTWTARGSHRNLHWTSEDTWTIDSVDGVDHGDGTYTLQDTPRS
jgi:hypothetical protein